MSETTYSIGPIMKAARKFKKFNQASVAQAIGCSQSALSKMEHNLLVPSAPQWFLFSRFTSIPPEALETGVIDRHSLVKFNNEEVSLGFKIPKKYRHFRAEKVREIYPFLKFLETGRVKFIQEIGLEPEFFLDFDNLINFQVFMDTIEYFVKKNQTSDEVIQQIVKVGQDDIYWNHYGIEWKKLKGPKEVLVEFVNEQRFFQADFLMKVEYQGSKVVMNYNPEFHLNQFAKHITLEQVDFLNKYRKFTLESLLERVLNIKVMVEKMERIEGSPLSAIFEIKF